ncbi:MAG: c-type cytochrome biogenesis protein CcmI [Gammaproteobacteria bacterium]|nr:c-type cytochrome biogenesis protein CcmI [Gammaproteobacteria bacterium]MCW8987933.1 c-type cytochrome biogenesis protein CcmI [Gammaproteobacteria bacterium]
MIMFWVLAIAMVVIALVFLLRPLRLDSNQSDIDRTAQNVAIAKERLLELKQELEEGVITQEAYEQTQQELEQSLLNDVEQIPAENIKLTNTQPYNRFAQLALIISVPVLAVALYASLGQPDLINGTKQETETAHTSADGKTQLGSVEDMVEKLAQRLKEEPNNAEGWFMLARSYMSMNRYKEAVAALEKTNQLVPDNAVVMLRYADALTMLRGGQMSGKPFELVKRAVELSPDNPTGLWLIGMGYEEQGAYKKAISYWNQLLPLLTDEPSKAEVNKLISQAKRKAGINTVENTEVQIADNKTESIKSITVTVSIDKNILNSVSANDVVFVFARALQGPPMPLAVVRKQVKDLPIEVILDDSMAMMPTMKLSSFDKVQIVARVSKSGIAKAQSGDLESEVSIASAGQREKVKLTINKSVP